MVEAFSREVDPLQDVFLSQFASMSVLRRSTLTSNLMTKLDIHNAAGLIRYAIQNKVVSILPNLKTSEQSAGRR